MTSAPIPRARGVVGSVARSPLTLWIAFIIVHLWLGYVNLFGPGLPLGDVQFTYKFWATQALYNDYWVGIHGVWVYPIAAIVPMLLAFAFGPDLYANTWLSIVMLLNTVAFGTLTSWGFTTDRLRTAAAWWWVAFLLVLGPITLGRIDSVSVPLAIVGVVLLAQRPAAATALLAVATWMKVWPAAVLAAIVVASKSRVTAVAASIGVSAVIIALALVSGSGGNVMSFFTQQSGRGLQVEAPVSTPFLWAAKLGVPGAAVYYDQGILTYQVSGEGTDIASALMTPLLAIIALAVLAIGLFAVRRGVPSELVLAPLALALVMTLIAVNKVGSPQFVSWLAVPVILGLITARGVSFRFPAILVLVIAGLTQAFYPYLYGHLLGLNTELLVVLTVRNILYFVVLGWTVRSLLSLAAQPEFSRSVGAR